MIALLLLTASLAGCQQDSRVLSDVRFLTDDRQEGRGAGTAGLERAGAYIRAAFARAGLQASFQDFTIPPDAPAVLHSGLGLRSHRPGDTVVIVSKREGAERRAAAVLGKRAS